MSDTQEKAAPGFARRLGKLATQIGRGRIALSLVGLVLAVLVARFSWNLPFAVDAEHALFDARVIATAPTVEQDNRVVMVPYTDETLIRTGKRSPLDRTTLAKALARLDTMGAKGIGIDILIDQPQSDDALLIKTFQSMKTPTFLAHASIDTASDKILYEQQQFLETFQKEIARGGNVHPTSIVIQTDSDNVMRKWADIIPGAPLRMPNALNPGDKAFTHYTGSLAYRRPALKDQPIFAAIPIDTFANDDLFQSPEAAAMFAQQIKGKYVLIGGNIQDIDIFQTPLTRGAGKDEAKNIWGMELFAHMLAQMMDGRLLKPVPNAVLWLAAFASVLAGAFTASFNRKPLVSGSLLAVQIAALGGIPFLLAANDIETYGLPAFGWIVGWLAAFIIAGSAARALSAEQRRFAQGALGKYLPADIAAEIMKDPDSLQLGGQKREIFVIFSDLEGFTKLSHAIEPEMVAKLLNRYLDMLSDVVLAHGGTIDKFVGDAVVAFWGAPISRPDDGERAVKAALAMHAAGEEFRRTVPQGVPPIGMTRVGLHHGEAIVGNFGGEGRIQYTALGDSMNTAARLESANKQTKSAVLVSESAKDRSGLDIFRPMGNVVLRGRASSIGIFEPVPDMPEAERKQFCDVAGKAIGGCADALIALEKKSETIADDKALTQLIYRLRNQERGGYFVLD
ncbi:adenylate/guanylate cyclase domain-containing protein [Sphingobium sp.]|uniref:adenylate/guanylate cyclase domain-containing protein n=1 Tax=Sphingobium sp. TaxID=1912891 RepID=UPI0028BDF8C4|nr:adenylate/guanylate cyclase domain-containing protein [Sphingobium sp.]